MNIIEYDNLTTLEKVQYFNSLPQSQRSSESLTFGVGQYDYNKPRGIEFLVGGKRKAR